MYAPTPSIAALLALTLAACAHDPALSRKIEGEAAQQPAVSPAERAQTAESFIRSSSLDGKQKARLEELLRETSRDMKELREREQRLRLLLVKQLVNPGASDREIEGIKRRILDANQAANKRWLAAIKDAQQALGRRSEEDARFYRAFMEDFQRPGGATDRGEP